jgi:hypothetical protein
VKKRRPAEGSMEDEATPAVLREILRKIVALHDEVGRLEKISTRLVEAIESEYRIRDRLEALQKDREDERHEKLEDALGDLGKQVDESIDDLKTRHENAAVYLRDLPDKLLTHVEKKIYELRTARWDALQSGAPVAMPGRDQTPPFGTSLQTYREQTGKIAVAAPDDVTLTPAQQRGLAKIAISVWYWARWVLLPAAGGGVLKAIEAIVNAVRHSGH